MGLYRFIKGLFFAERNLYALTGRWCPGRPKKAFLWDGRKRSQKALQRFIGQKAVHFVDVNLHHTVGQLSKITLPKNTFIWRVGNLFYIAPYHYVDRHYEIKATGWQYVG